MVGGFQLYAKLVGNIEKKKKEWSVGCIGV